MLNKQKLFEYIIENYTLSGEAGRLVDNALEMILVYEPEDECQVNMAHMVLDAIGVKIEEIEQFVE